MITMERKGQVEDDSRGIELLKKCPPEYKVWAVGPSNEDGSVGEITEVTTDKGSESVDLKFT